ncbi:MAG: hypothetical protein GTN89_09855 [Acidobacteria bacterium]|nr:hypothetical protein [Acidobacteriota bacterium]NIQ30658.1 hypothetical protein [Acidobacteriota bacterium]NIQ85616.1 hypothetical protein [Acidobacteriota bacterium]
MEKISSHRTFGRLTTCVVMAAFVLLLSTQDSIASPSFARKYETSCQTCHVAYPKLNTFGQAFRTLGYRMPGETEDQVKVPDVSLGSEAYKRVWPKAVWPGAIPKNIPVALVSEFLIVNNSRLEDEGGTPVQEKVRKDFVFPSSIELVVAGTAGDHVAYFGEIEFVQEPEDGSIHSEIEIGHLDVRFIRPIKNSLAFNFKVGSWQPELVSTFDHARRLTVANYDSMFAVNTTNPGGAESVGSGGHHGGGGGIALPAVARGIDMYGVAGNRFTWSAGVMNGLEGGHDSFDANSEKDYYGRVAYKVGGLAPDGSNAADYAGSDKNWQENSFTIGVFGYWGDGDLEEPREFLEDDMLEHFIETPDYTRQGVDFNWFYKNLNVFGAFVNGEDDVLTYELDLTDPTDPVPGAIDAGASGTFEYDAWFVEADVVMGVPWLHGAFRYETVDFPKIEGGLPVPDFERGTIHLTGLVRANVKTFVEYTWDLDQSKNYDLWIGAGIAF